MSYKNKTLNPPADNKEPLSEEELSRLEPVIISVVGPTNEGKTSVLRTLTGDPQFGEINSLTGTTGHAEYKKIFYHDKAEVLRLIDTPGFQMSSAIVDQLQEREGATGIEAILEAIPESDENYRHDLRAWKEVRQSQIVIYIANLCESPAQSLLRDTLTLLEQVERPVIVVFNNIPTQIDGAPPLHDGFEAEWTKVLRRSRFYSFQKFDAHRRDFRDEYELFERIVALVRDPLAKRAVRAELMGRLRLEELRIERSRETIAEFLYDMALTRTIGRNVPRDQVKARRETLAEELSSQVARRCQQVQKDLFDIWRFTPDILDRKFRPLEQEFDERDHHFGRRLKKHLTRGVAIGAGVGLLIDVAAGLTTAGLGSVLGGILGGFLGGAGFNYKFDTKQKKLMVKLGRDAFPFLLSQCVELVKKLQVRGQAVDVNIQLKLAEDPQKVRAPEIYRLFGKISKDADLAEIFHLPGSMSADLPDRQNRIDDLCEALESVLPPPNLG